MSYVEDTRIDTSAQNSSKKLELMQMLPKELCKVLHTLIISMACNSEKN